MNAVDLILRKRDHGSLRPEEIRDLIDQYTKGNVPDYQMSAFLMAAFLNGMSTEEATALTESMLYSGDVLDLSDIPGIKVDKHSTGGVGDKVSLLLAPIVAACGVPVPMISGRGLGHTGGTLDKLESISGFTTELDIASYRDQLEDIGVVMIGQTAEIAPADKKIYALRDVTGTVEFIPFIAASIMSKKLAEGIDALVLDVKCGSGAFMKTEEDAGRLAETLVRIGERFGKKTVAWMTGMESPLGCAVGNWPEMDEAIRCLQGDDVPDLMEVTHMLAAEMLVMGGVAETVADGVFTSKTSIQDGSAMDKMRELIARQGGDAKSIEKTSVRTDEHLVGQVVAPAGCSPRISGIDALLVGRASIEIGAGRKSKEDEIDPNAGFRLLKKVGDPVRPGDVLVNFYASDDRPVNRAEGLIEAAYSFGDELSHVPSRLMKRFGNGSWLNLSDINSV